jgi:hypothetical protein
VVFIASAFPLSATQRGYLHPALLHSRNIAGVATSSRGELVGQLTSSGRKDGGDFAIGGWAILPGSHRFADSVLLAYEDAHGDVGLLLPAVSQKLDDEAYVHCSRVKSWRADELPPDAPRVSAWAFDAEPCQAFPIGAVSL